MKEGKKHREIAQLHELEGRVSPEEQWNGLSAYFLYLRHQKAYLYAGEYCKDKTVFEYGCGNGYGSFYLSGMSQNVVAVDINKTVIHECKKQYQNNNLFFQLVEPEKNTGFDESSFDVVVSFQVIEHIYDVPGYLNELKRVMKENGVLIITTPNRKYRLYPFQKPVNPYHVREYGLKQLKSQLQTAFESVTVLGIDGTPEINAVEYKRVNKSLLKAFVPKAVKRLLKSGPGKSVSHGNSVLNKEVLGKYSIDDYSIIENNVKNCLDFLAVLRKKREGV
jgi:2-polyprenyl-3-methyl-5-hydroxy-6-metoxy-1,4-benzoquinol methylase